MTNTGSLIKVGSGTFTLSGNNTFTGKGAATQSNALNGEITVTGEAWIEDMDLTQVAFDRLMMNFLGCLREGGEAIEAVLNGKPAPNRVA